MTGIVLTAATTARMPARLTVLSSPVMIEKARLPSLGYASPLEELDEKFHASPKLLQDLNPGATFDRAGEEILVPAVAHDPPGKAVRIVVDGTARSVSAYDRDDRVLARYPATVGSRHDPLPVGRWKIRGRRIDLCVATYEEAMQFGRRTVTVYILGKP